MNAPRGCAPFIDAILDEAGPRPEGLEGHLAACTSCRALAALHAAARALPPPGVAAPPAVLEREVRERVRRRRAIRGSAVGLAAAAAVLLLVLAPPRPAETPPRRGDLFALADGVAELTRRDPLTGDPALGALGAVSDWLAPPRARSFGFDSITPPPDARAPAGGDAP
jgi:anti-sigma factor RsiW